MEGELRIDIRWKRFPPNQVQLGGRLRCSVQCVRVLGGKWPVYAAELLPKPSAKDYDKNTGTTSLTHKFSEHTVHYSLGKILASLTWINNQRGKLYGEQLHLQNSLW
jgi:hypothetical protein